MNLNELFSKNKAELNKLNKAEIVEVLLNNKWNFEYLERQVKDLSNDLKVAKAPYDQAKQMLLGATMFEAPIDEYSKKPDITQVDLCFLIGLLLSKGSQ